MFSDSPDVVNRSFRYLLISRALRSSALIFNVVLIYLGILFGSHWEILLKYFDEYSYVGIAIFAVIIIYLIVRVIRNRNGSTQLNK